MKFYYNRKNGAVYPFHKAYQNIPHMEEIDEETAWKIISAQRAQAEEIRKARQLIAKKASLGEAPDDELLQKATAKPVTPPEVDEALAKVDDKHAEELVKEAVSKTAPKPQRRKRKPKKAEAEPAPEPQPVSEQPAAQESTTVEVGMPAGDVDKILNDLSMDFPE